MKALLPNLRHGKLLLFVNGLPVKDLSKCKLTDRLEITYIPKRRSSDPCWRLRLNIGRQFATTDMLTLYQDWSAWSHYPTYSIAIEQIAKVSSIHDWLVKIEIEEREQLKTVFHQLYRFRLPTTGWAFL